MAPMPDRRIQDAQRGLVGSAYRGQKHRNDVTWDISDVRARQVERQFLSEADVQP